MSPPDADARTLARAFLEQTLSAEGNALMLEHATREEVIRGLASARRPVRAHAAGPPDRGPDPAATGPEIVTGPQIAEAPDLETLAALVASCTRCTLHESRKNPVFGEGAADARVVCVGEAPGAREDETGRPFVGRAGGLLDRLLLSIGLPRKSVYICNVLKSRPPRNRDPLPEEVAACSPYLLRQLALIEPEVIIAFGAFAARTLLETKSALGRLRGTVHRYSGYPVVATYHPAALLRNPGWIRPTWEDLQIVRRMLDGVGDRGARND
ncbi:MAG: uracil-DNA glycosylase [Gemmatimonadales bacterium]|nr:uracil-DNA glycosylase [Candidatus Palauibacter irciniicola]MYC18185.1 uracil-DNA glycosylase [Gemmatimonadales bacterium]